MSGMGYIDVWRARGRGGLMSGGHGGGVEVWRAGG